jgi:CDP-glycerol glycerophosphotransferase
MARRYAAPVRSEAGPVPLISVIIPVFKVEDSLRACLDSVLGQAFSAVEVIAVDDHSPDRSGEILDEYAKRDDRVFVVHLERNAGPGNARNTGFGFARGEYVWFVDGDDWIADGALDAIAGRLTGTGGADVLLIGFDRVQPSGRAEPNAWRHVLSAPSPAVFTLGGRPDVLKLTMTAWSKLIRREFMAGLGLRFGPGIHEDVPVTCTLLLAAERISVLDRVCYHYRQQRRGALTNTPSDSNFAVFSRYPEVFDYIAERPGGLAQFRTALFDRMIWHYTTILGDRGCVPRRSRREFLRRASSDFARYRPEGYRYPSGVHGVKYRLVEHGSYGLYMAVQPVNEARLALRALFRGPLRRALPSSLRGAPAAPSRR